jgi:hypothetical protein
VGLIARFDVFEKIQTINTHENGGKKRIEKGDKLRSVQSKNKPRQKITAGS